MAYDGPNAEPVEHDGTLIPSAVVPFLQILGWDGALPLLTASVPIAIKTFWPDRWATAIVILLSLPLIAASIRLRIAWDQIAKRCGGYAPVSRRLAMSAAMALLLWFEGAVGALTFAKDVPLVYWWFPVGFYAGYLVMVSLALLPNRPTPVDTVSDP